MCCLSAPSRNEASKKVAVAEILDIDFGKEAHDIRDNKNLRIVEFSAEAGQTYTFHKYFAVYTDNDRSTAADDAAISERQRSQGVGLRSYASRITTRAGPRNGRPAMSKSTATMSPSRP